MNALGDLVARDRRSDDPALVAATEERRYDYHRFCTTAWKTGNFWRRIGVHASDEIASGGSSVERSESDGVHDDATVAVADEPAPEVVLSFLGAALLGARTRFGLPAAGSGDSARTTDAQSTEKNHVDARVVVAPRDRIHDFEVPPGGKRVAYDGPPDDPSVAHFERDVWSENPSFPETPIDPETVALVTETENFSHADLLTAARTVADDWDLAPGDEVAVRAPLAAPGTVVAGLVAPLLAGAAILFPDEKSVGDFAVVAGDEDGATKAHVPESEAIVASAVV